MNASDKAFEKVVELAGGKPAVARLCGISKQAVYKWKSIPAEHCLTIERALSGQVDRHQMRPDVFGERGQAA